MRSIHQSASAPRSKFSITASHWKKVKRYWTWNRHVRVHFPRRQTESSNRFTPIEVGFSRSSCRDQTQGTILVPNVLRGSSMPRLVPHAATARFMLLWGRSRNSRCNINCISFNDYHLSTNSLLGRNATCSKVAIAVDCSWHVIKPSLCADH